jgi:hypothetical protein
MKLTYVITTRNRRDALLRTLDHLQRVTPLAEQAWEVLVVDNGSTDGTGDALAGRRDVTVISLAENEGVPARNLAIAQARGKFVALLDDDTRPADQTIARALNYLSRHSKCGAVTGRVLLAGNQSDAPALPAVLMGGASIVRKTVLDEVGGFAAEFFRQEAEYDLSFRIWRAGFRIDRFEDLCFEREPRPGEPPSPLSLRMDLRNNLILAERYLPRPIRREYRRDWIRRYALLSRSDPRGRGANAALKEARVWARREMVIGRKPLPPDAVESVFHLGAQRRAVAAWARSCGARRVCIADWGKNVYATWSACRSAGLSVEAILENANPLSGADYRGTPVLRDAQSAPVRLDAVVLSTLNPATAPARASELRARLRVPVLELWHPTFLDPPLPAPVRPVEEAA